MNISEISQFIQTNPFLLGAIKILIIIIAAWLLVRIIRKTLDKVVRKAVTPSGFKDSIAEKKREDTLIEILQGLATILVWIIAFLMIVAEFGVAIAPLVASLGVIGVAVGFGGQYIIRDLITGIFIIWENQYRIGDWVRINNDIEGTVEHLSLRTTLLRDSTGTLHTIPNGEIKITSNESKDFSSIWMKLNIASAADPVKVEKVVNQVGLKLSTDPQWEKDIKEAPTFNRIDGFAYESYIIVITGKTRPGKQWAIAGELRLRLKQAFDKKGIEMKHSQFS